MNLSISIFQQLESIQRSLIPCQDGILTAIGLTAKITKEVEVAQAEIMMESLRKTEKALRERLMVLTVAHLYDWKLADRLSVKFKGAYVSPELAEVMKEEQK